MAIDYDKLREDLRDDSFAAYFGGGIGPAILDAFDAEDASDEELEEMAIGCRGFLSRMKSTANEP